MKGLAETVNLTQKRIKRTNVSKGESIEERFAIITHKDSERIIYTKFTYSEGNFSRFLKIIDTLHDRKCRISKSTLEEFEDYPDIFSDEKLEISIDEELGKYTNKI